MALLTNSHANTTSDHDALLSIREFIIHDPLNSFANWNANVSFCTWTGVKCTSRRERVVQLNLSSVGLEGSISPLVGNLSFLRTLSLFKNSLRGHLPQQLGCLYDNQFEGELVLHDNQLVGHIPSEFGQKLANLQLLRLWGNQLSGNIPTSLSNSSKLTILHLNDNQLSGAVPIELGKLHLLEDLRLQRNQLISGSTSDLLTALTNCSRLRQIKLHHNLLTGVLPSAMGQLSSNLSVLLLQNNFIGGKIPHEIGNLSSLTCLNLSFNLFTGSIPSSFEGLENLERLFLDDNRLQGSIPSKIGQLKYLGLFSAGNNLLSGTIPDSFAYLSQLRKLFLHGDNYSGNIPTSLGECRNLEVLDLSHNRFSGSIPPNIAGLPNLQFYLNLSRNSLEGPLPPEIGKMEMVQAIHISGNRLSGLIPATLESCSELAYLDLSENEFKGPIPAELGKLQSLQNMDLSRNNLSGEIPEALGNLKMLQKLNLSFNNLTGEIPKTGIFRNQTAVSLVGNPGLCGPWMVTFSCVSHSHFSETDEAHTTEEKLIKPANVLLDEDLTACVTDFGIARLACSNSMHSLSSTLALKGSVGYIAPEYGVGGEVSAKGDVYSYGVLLLEMFTRKRPINEMFVGELNLHKWVRSAFPNRVLEVVDSCLFPNSSEEMEENELHNKHSLVDSVLHLGLLCTNESPRDRPTMRDVVGILDRLRASFVGSADTSRLTPTILVRNTGALSSVDAGTSDSQTGSTL
eukprot:Gb_24723 [translate_table: standard]